MYGNVICKYEKQMAYKRQKLTSMEEQPTQPDDLDICMHELHGKMMKFNIWFRGI